MAKAGWSVPTCWWSTPLWKTALAFCYVPSPQAKPVIATEACGIGGLPGVTVIPEGDSTKLRSILMKQVQICQNDISFG